MVLPFSTSPGTLFKSCKIAPNSFACTFSSNTPNLSFLSKTFIISFSSTLLPAPKISSSTNLNPCATPMSPPIWPEFIAKKAAEPKLRICVAGE